MACLEERVLKLVREHLSSRIADEIGVMTRSPIYLDSPYCEGAPAKKRIGNDPRRLFRCTEKSHLSRIFLWNIAARSPLDCLLSQPNSLGQLAPTQKMPNLETLNPVH